MQASCASPDLHEMEDTPFALKIPEILQHIFELSDEKSNCNSNVLVCKAWSDPCMNAIWREVNDLYRLVKLLGPTSVSYSSIEFVTNNEPLDWTRFYFYARRVRRVVYPGVTRKSLRDVFEDISFHRSSNPLLPNLKILDLNSLSVSSRSYMKNFCFMFMEPTLEEYHLRLESVSSAAGLSLNLQTVANKCPHLNLVDISLPHADNDMADVVLDFIKKTPNVSSISLSPFHQMIPFTSVLQNFPYLKRLIIGGHRVHETVADTPCIKSLALTSPTGGGYFVSLTTLSVVAPYSMAEEFLTNTLRLLNRISISSDLRKPETPSSVKHLLERLVEKCPRMETLHLSYSFVTEKNYSRFPAPGCIVQVAHLRPILSYSAMKSFKFEHPFPVTLADKFAEEIASSWPHLQQLSLGHTPVLRRRDFKNCFTLRALLSFARHCRNIEYLALLVAPESSTCPTSADIMLLPEPIFPRLRTLDVGFSMLYECDKAKVAWTLGQLLPERCSLYYEQEETGEDSSLRRQNWISIKERMYYEFKLQEQELEIQRLRTQLSVESSSRPSK